MVDQRATLAQESQLCLILLLEAKLACLVSFCFDQPLSLYAAA